MKTKTKKNLKLKLYAWDGVLESYTGGLAVALATSADEARKLIHREWAKQISPADLTWRDSNLERDLMAEPSVHPGRASFVICGGD